MLAEAPEVPPPEDPMAHGVKNRLNPALTFDTLVEGTAAWAEPSAPSASREAMRVFFMVMSLGEVEGTWSIKQKHAQKRRAFAVSEL